MFYLMYEVPAPSTVGEKTANKKKMTKEIHKIWKMYIYFDNLKKPVGKQGKNHCEPL